MNTVSVDDEFESLDNGKLDVMIGVYLLEMCDLLLFPSFSFMLDSFYFQ